MYNTYLLIIYLNSSKMKTVIATFILTILFLSCTTTKSVVNRDIYPGMTIEEFRKEVPKATLHSFNDSIAIYRLDANIWLQSDWTPQFFYFKNGNLRSTDRGTRALDYREKKEIDINVKHEK